MDVYIDILFLENVVINYLILMVTARFSKSQVSSLRLLAGAAVGAVYVVILVLFPGMQVYNSILAKIALGFLIIGVAFTPVKLKTFIKVLAIFLISTFIFAGAAFAFLYMNQSGGFVQNGIVYLFWQSKWTLLFFSIMAVAIIIKVFWEVIQVRLTRDKLLLPLIITFEKKTIGMEALVDTGNSLHDPLTNMPVVVVEFKVIKELLPPDIKLIFEQSKENDLASVTDIVSKSAWFSRFRLIPFTSLGKENGMLLGFKPDYIEIGKDSEKKGVSEVIVGIYNRALSKNEKYNALLSPELI